MNTDQLREHFPMKRHADIFSNQFYENMVAGAPTVIMKRRTTCVVKRYVQASMNAAVVNVNLR